ncbi:TMEM165/GDT1 family protein [Natronoglycomyces albus]|uniref:GDT1 family protein n=1 Tax=Natronoglycomyces albus TaxID=2811108 RepID=A0A895XRP6_9ACTN|nr:TMEM165/GDT1 family protein [Natronoglycomyces albus]QSB04288.1 TMEM165/GDT1 family protein [Natronoglycomyces albus]
MDGFTTALLVSIGVVFLAELGDKSQIMALTFASRYRFWPVLIGISAAAALLHAISVAIGFGLGLTLPTGWITLAAAVVFLAFALWTVLEKDDDDDGADTQPSARWWRAPVLTIFMAFVLAEIGDKTMLATIVLATQYQPWGVWAGATVGMVTSSLIAIAVGAFLGKTLPKQAVRYGAAVLFALFGLFLAYEGIRMLLS